MKQHQYVKVALPLLMAFITAEVVQAHHSFPAQYDIDKPATMSGMVTKVDWRNPHVYFFMDVTNADGSITEWSFELANVSAMRGRGWEKDTLQPGDLRLQVQVATDEIAEPVTKEESTRVYGDE